jgi:hypothetical protein
MRLEEVEMRWADYDIDKVATRRDIGSSKARKFLKSHRDAIADNAILVTNRESNKFIPTSGSRRDAT